MNNNQGTNELAIGVMIMVAIAVVLAIAGVIVALVAVIGFVLNEWRKTYRYEGKTPILWLAGVTAIVAIPCIIGALEQFRLFSFHLERQSDQWPAYAIGAIAYIVALAAPTAAYWVYRLIQPVSHFRVRAIEAVHNSYQEGQITKKTRNKMIEGFQSIADDDLEEQVIQRRSGTNKSQRPTSAAFDIPDQD